MGLEPGFGLGEGLDGEVRAGAGFGFGARDEEGLAKAGGIGGGDVGAAVANQDGLREVKREIAGGAEEHAGRGFAVFVLVLVLADAVLGMVGAVVDGDEGDALFLELCGHPVHERFEVGGGVEAARDAGLVGDDDQLVAKRLGGAAEGEDAVDEADVGGAVEVADLVVDDAVAVEEESFLSHRLRVPQALRAVYRFAGCSRWSQTDIRADQREDFQGYRAKSSMKVTK